MCVAERGPARRDRRLDAGLVQRDHVRVALHDVRVARARDRGEEPRRRHAWRERPDIGGASERVEAGRGDDDDHRRDGQREGQAPHQLPVQRMR